MKSLREHKEKIAIILILLIAAALRLYRIQDFLVFLGDEGRDALAAYGILHGQLTLLGPRASAGNFFTGPIYYYMMAPFLFLFNYSPVGPAVMIALLSTATVGLLYYIAKKFLGITAGFIAAILYTVSPLVITYSRSSWNPNPMPFFTLLLLYILYLGVKKHSWKYTFTAGILYGITLQLHYIEVVIGVVVFFFVLISSFMQNWLYEKTRFRIKSGMTVPKVFLSITKQYGQIFFGFLIGFSPFIAFEFRHQFENTKTILSFIAGDTDGKNLTGSPFWNTVSNVFSNFFGHLIYNYPTIDLFHNYPSWLLQIWMIAIVLFTFIAIYFLRFIKDKLFLVLLLLWLVFGVGMFGFYQKPIYDYYFEFMFPLAFLLYGNFLGRLITIKRWQPITRSFAIIFFIFLVGYAIWTSPVKDQPNRQMQQMQQIADFIIQKSDNQSFNFALLAHGNSPHAYLYFFHVAHRDPVTLDNLLDDPQRKTVTNQLFVVCEDIPCQPVANPDFPIAGFGQGQIVNEWNVSVVKIYKLVHYNPSSSQK